MSEKSKTLDHSDERLPTAAMAPEQNSSVPDAR
jgi:hypothetical protein